MPVEMQVHCEILSRHQKYDKWMINRLKNERLKDSEMNQIIMTIPINLTIIELFI